MIRGPPGSTPFPYTTLFRSAGQFRQIEPLITARSFQFHVQVIGYALPSGRYRVLEAIVDLIGPEPRVLYLRDLTKLGAPYPFATR